MKLKDLITTEEQYEVAKTKATLAFETNFHIELLQLRLDKHFPGHSRKV